MTCEDCQNLLAFYAMGSLDESEAGQVRAHLESGCRDCAANLAAMRTVIDVLPLTLTPARPPPNARSRLMERIAGASHRGPVRERQSLPEARTSRFGRLIEALLTGAVAALITAGVFWYFFDQQRKSLASVRLELDQAQSAIRELRASVTQANDSIQLLKSPAVQLVSLDGTAEQPRAKARVYWDQSRGAWHLDASNLKPLVDGKTYELWLIDSDQRKIPAGTFNVDKTGEGALTAQLKSPPTRAVAFAVTNEPPGGSPQPTGQIQLIGQLK